MKKRILYIVILVLNTLFLNAQQMDIVWQQCLGTDVDDSPRCITNTHNGFLSSTSIISNASNISNFHGGADAWLVEIDTLGNIIWEKCFGGSDADGIKKIIPLLNNEYYLFGSTNSNDGDIQSFNHNSGDLWVVKIDSIGNIIWEKCYGSYHGESPIDAIATDDGGLIIMGSFFNPASGDITMHYGKTDMWVCRIDSVGNIVWEKTFGNHESEKLRKIIHTSQNTYMLIGGFDEKGGMIECEKDSSVMQRDLWLIEIDANGEIIKQFCYGGSNWDVGYDIIEVSDGYVFIGFTTSNDMDVSGNHGYSWDIYGDIWVVHIGIHGNIIWQNCLGGSRLDFPEMITETQDSGFVIFGTTSSLDGDVSANHAVTPDNNDIWMVKLDQYGEIQWNQCFGSHAREEITPNGIAKINDYNYGLIASAYLLGGNVECSVDPNTSNTSRDAWIFQIKDCSHYQPTTPQKPIGKDYLCVNTDSITTYTTIPATNAWYYEWELQPEDAGTITMDSITTTVNWNPNYEGPATIKVSSTNDCGTSAWSDSLIVNTYICLGNEEYELGNVPAITVYPNPAKTKLYIRYNTPINNNQAKVEIFDSFGALISTFQVGKNLKDYVDVSNWSTGLYFVRVMENGKTIGVKKVVVE